MKRPSFLRLSIYSLVALVALLSVLGGTLYSSTSAYAASAKINYDPNLIFGQALHVDMKHARKISASSASGIPPCLNSDVPPRCFSPQQLYTTYGIQRLLNAGITGKGRTIVIIDIAASPNVEGDLHLYDQLYGLKDPTLNIFTPFGKPAVNFGADIETALDIETAHSIAPAATIDLVLADVSGARSFNDELGALLRATKYAIDNNLGDVISQSFGVGESCVGSAYLQAEREAFRAARAKGITLLAASGDSGVVSISCGSQDFYTKSVSIPASDPLVTSVGGTTLDANVKTGGYIAETTWNEWSAGYGATGGGFSAVFPRPSYQDGVFGSGLTPNSGGGGGGSGRGIPDVAYDADPLTGVPVVVSNPSETIIVPVGGTSIGSPQWAGIVALADQFAGKRLGFLNGAIYRIGKSALYSRAFHDITTGNNTVTIFSNSGGGGGGQVTIQGYDAGTGWDAVTGFGTPKTTTLVPLLALYDNPSDGSGL